MNVIKAAYCFISTVNITNKKCNGNTCRHYGYYTRHYEYLHICACLRLGAFTGRTWLHTYTYNKCSVSRYYFYIYYYHLPCFYLLFGIVYSGLQTLTPKRNRKHSGPMEGDTPYIFFNF